MLYLAVSSMRTVINDPGLYRLTVTPCPYFPPNSWGRGFGISQGSPYYRNNKNPHKKYIPGKALFCIYTTFSTFSPISFMLSSESATK